MSYIHFILAKMVDNMHKRLDAQHSDGWHTARKYRIGASEIATLMGINPYKKVEDLLREKESLQRIWVLRKHLADMNPQEAMEFVLKQMAGTQNNEELLVVMNK